METKILYYLDSDTHILVEIKFDKSKIYYWLLFDKDNDKFEKLDFVSMSEYERIFKQGKLKLNFQNATLFLNDKIIDLNVIKDSKTINYTLINIISNDLLKSM